MDVVGHGLAYSGCCRSLGQVGGLISSIPFTRDRVQQAKDDKVRLGLLFGRKI